MPTQAHSERAENDCHDGVRVKEHAVLRRVPLVPVEKPAYKKREESSEKEQGRDPQPGAQQVAGLGSKMRRAALDQRNLAARILAVAFVARVVTANVRPRGQYRFIAGDGRRLANRMTVGSWHGHGDRPCRLTA